MGEYCYEYEVNSPVLKDLVGEKLTKYTPISYGEVDLEFETFSARGDTYRPERITVGSRITAVVLEDVTCNTLYVGVRIENNPYIIRLYELYNNIPLQTAIFYELNSFNEDKSHTLITMYK